MKYHRQPRFAGKTKYPLMKMISYAGNAIFSFSSKPLRIATRLGVLVVFLGIIFGAYIAFIKIFTDVVVAGFSIFLVTNIIFTGMQILFIGLVGEYIARIFEEVKDRPLYIVREDLNE